MVLQAQRAQSVRFLTKVVAPRVAAGRTLRRGRLLEQLHVHLAQGQRATLVTAPAGYGKTTLLAQFAAEVEGLTAWCTLDEQDGDAATLLGSLMAAVARKVPGFGWRTQQALGALEALAVGSGGGAVDVAQQGHLVRAAVGALVTELQEVDDFLVLVLDDCHALLGEASAATVLDPLIERLPEHCHVVLAGRTLPEVRCLRALAGRRQVGRVEQGQLKLTAAETAELVERAGVGRLEKEAVEALHAETQGWPMAVLLLAPHLAERGSGADGAVSEAAPAALEGAAAEARAGKRDGGKVRVPRRARRELFGFLATEVLGRQPAALQAFLLRCSVLPRVEVGRCAALLGRPEDEVRRLLAAAEERGLFLTRLEEAAPGAVGRMEGEEVEEVLPGGFEERVSYRFHDLFRELLLETLRDQQRGRYRWLQRRASGLAERAGETAQAIEHALAGKHFGRAARLVEGLGTVYAGSGRWHALRRWLGALPEGVMDGRPRLLLLEARVERAVRGDPERAETLLRRAASVMQEVGQQAELALEWGRFMDWRGCYAASADWCREALRAMEDGAAAGLRAAVNFWLGQALLRQGLLSEARDAYATAASLCGGTGLAATEAEARTGMATVLLQAGQLAEGISELQRVRAIWQRLENVQGHAQTLNNLGVAEHQSGNFREARTLLAEAVRVAHNGGWRQIEACAWLSLGDVERDGNDLQAAHAAYERGSALASETQNGYLVRYAVDALGHIKRLRNELTGAERAARQAVHEAQAAGSQHEQGTYVRSVALAHLARGEWDEARAALDRSRELLAACGARRELARTRLWRGQLEQAAGRSEQARCELSALGELLKELGYHGFLLGDARQMLPLLEEAVAQDVGGSRLAALLADASRRETSSTATGAETSPAARAETDSPAHEEGAPLPDLEAFALGMSEVRVNGRAISAAEWRRRKGKELFFYLLCHPDWQRRERIEADVWPDSSKAQARSAFHTNAHFLRRSLHKDVLEMQRGRYRLNPKLRCWLDADAFEGLCRGDERTQAQQGGQTKLARLNEAISLYRGPFLEDLGPEWAEERRRRLETAYVEALVELGHEHVRRGGYDAAVRLAERALEIDAYLDAAHEVVMLARMAAGQSAAALHHYTCHAERLRRELNGTPAPVLQALRERVAAHAPATLAG